MNLRSLRAADGLAFAIVVLLLGMLLWSAGKRAYDPDEFQHIQIAWLIAIGELPYRDFFEHHTPLYHYLVAPLLDDRAILTDGDAAIAAVERLRIIGVLLCVALVAMTWAIALHIGDRLSAAFAALLLASSAIFAMKALEIRPDQLAALLALGTTLALIAAHETRCPVLCCVLAAALATFGVLTTQKLLFAGPGFVVTFAAVAAHHRFTFVRALYAVLAMLAAAIVAALPLALHFAQGGALGALARDNFLLGAEWTRDVRPLVLALAGIARDETLFVAVAAFGCFALIARGWPAARWPLAMIAPMLSMVILMPLFPVVQQQYLFLLLPYAAVLGGIGASYLVRTLNLGVRQRAAVALAMIGLIGAHGALVIKTQSTAEDRQALASLRYLVEQTPPDATVLRGWSGGVAFRKPAFFYFSLHPEIRAVIADHEMTALATALQTGSRAPTIVEFDDAMRAMPPPVVSLLRKGWEPTGTGVLWKRKAARSPR